MTTFNLTRWSPWEGTQGVTITHYTMHDIGGVDVIALHDSLRPYWARVPVERVNENTMMCVVRNPRVRETAP